MNIKPMSMIKRLVLLLMLLASVGVASATLTLVTDAPSSETTNGAVLNGNLTSSSFPVTAWFEWGRDSSMYLYKTANQTINANGTYSATVSGLPIVANTQYYYRACGNNGTDICGAQQTFTTSAIGEIADNDFDAHFDSLVESELNPTNMSSVGAAPYTDIFGSIFWGVLFGAIFIFIWIRSEDVTIPSIVGLIIGGSLWAMMPADWVSMAMSLTIVSFGGLIYTLIKGRG